MRACHDCFAIAPQCGKVNFVARTCGGIYVIRPNARLSCRGRLQETWTPKNQDGGPGQLQPLVRLRLRSSFDREYSSPAYAPTPRKYATSPLGNHGAGSRCPRHTLYYRTTRTSEPDLRSGHVRRLVETPHSGPRGRSPWTRWLRLLRPLAHLRRYRSDDRRRYHLAQ